MFVTTRVTGNTITLMYVNPCDANDQNIRMILEHFGQYLGVPHGHSVCANKCTVGWCYSSIINHIYMT